MQTHSELLRLSDARRRLPAPSMRTEIRQAARVSCEEMAATLGVHKSTIFAWEAGATPQGRYIVAYVELLEELRAVVEGAGDAPASR